jgi:hypothetical protein
MLGKLFYECAPTLIDCRQFDLTLNYDYKCIHPRNTKHVKNSLGPAAMPSSGGSFYIQQVHLKLMNPASFLIQPPN